MPSTKDNQQFFNDMLPNSADFLDTCLDWIRDKYNPDDVFSISDLKEWAEDNGYVKED